MISRLQFSNMDPYQNYQFFTVWEDRILDARCGQFKFFDEIVSVFHTYRCCFFCNSILEKTKQKYASREAVGTALRCNSYDGYMFNCPSCSWWGLSEWCFNGGDVDDFFHMGIVAKFKSANLVKIITDVQIRLDALIDNSLLPDRDRMIMAAIEFLASYGSTREVGRTIDNIITLLYLDWEPSQLICLKWFPFGKVKIIAVEELIGFHFSEKHCAGVTILSADNDIFSEVGSRSEVGGVRIKLKSYDELIEAVCNGQNDREPWNKFLSNNELNFRTWQKRITCRNC